MVITAKHEAELLDPARNIGSLKPNDFLNRDQRIQNRFDRLAGPISRYENSSSNRLSWHFVSPSFSVRLEISLSDPLANPSCQHRRDRVADLSKLPSCRANKSVVIREGLQSRALPHTKRTGYFRVKMRAPCNDCFRRKIGVKSVNSPKLIPGAIRKTHVAQQRSCSMFASLVVRDASSRLE